MALINFTIYKEVIWIGNKYIVTIELMCILWCPLLRDRVEEQKQIGMSIGTKIVLIIILLHLVVGFWFIFYQLLPRKGDKDILENEKSTEESATAQQDKSPINNPG